MSVIICIALVVKSVTLCSLCDVLQEPAQVGLHVQLVADLPRSCDSRPEDRVPQHVPAGTQGWEHGLLPVT